MPASASGAAISPALKRGLSARNRSTTSGPSARFLTANPGFTAADLAAREPELLGRAEAGPGVQLLPHRDGTDGFFIARIERT